MRRNLVGPEPAPLPRLKDRGVASPRQAFPYSHDRIAQRRRDLAESRLQGVGAVARISRGRVIA